MKKIYSLDIRCTIKVGLLYMIFAPSGIICMCDAEGNGLESLMGVFRLPNREVRVCMLPVSYSIVVFSTDLFTSYTILVNSLH